MRKFRRNILAIGDSINSIISYRERLFEHSTYLINNGVGLQKVDYSDLEKGVLPVIEGEEVLPILFFPQFFRNKNIDKWIKKDGIFGGNTHLKEIDRYYEKMGNLLKGSYGEKVKFLNPPEAISKTRDKRKVKKELLKLGINTPEPIYSKDVGELMELSKDEGIYIKLPGWGYGQGITFVKGGECKTNLVWDGDLIHSDFNATFKEFVGISKPVPFLEKLLKVDPHIEKEVHFKKINGKKFDLRLYLVGNPFVKGSTKVPFWFPRSNDPEKITTNWCQGGEIHYGSEFRSQIPEEALEKAKSDTLKLAENLKMHYGGVDIMFDEDWNSYFIEAQTDCGLPNPDQFDLLLYTAQKLIEG